VSIAIFSLYILEYFVFTLAFVLGSLIIPMTRVNETIFPSMAAFNTNSLLLCGVFAYFLADKKSRMRRLIKNLIDKLINV
jgi:hypothetical protein